LKETDDFLYDYILDKLIPAFWLNLFAAGCLN